MGEIIPFERPKRKEANIREEMDRLLMEYFRAQIHFLRLWIRIWKGL